MVSVTVTITILVTVTVRFKLRVVGGGGVWLQAGARTASSGLRPAVPSTARCMLSTASLMPGGVRVRIRVRCGDGFVVTGSS